MVIRGEIMLWKDIKAQLWRVASSTHAKIRLEKLRIRRRKSQVISLWSLSHSAVSQRKIKRVPCSRFWSTLSSILFSQPNSLTMRMTVIVSETSCTRPSARFKRSCCVCWIFLAIQVGNGSIRMIVASETKAL